MDPLAHLAIKTHFGVVDWAIVVGFLAVSTGLGLYAQRHIRNMADYVVAGRTVKTYLGVASIIAAELGLVTVMYSAQKGFLWGFSAFMIAFVSAAVALVVGLTGFIVVPLRQTGVMTIPEFYERRFGRGARVLGGTILAFSGILNMGMFLKTDSLFITSVMGLTSPAALKIAMTIILGLVLLYTMLGGMISVLVTDYMQFTVMAIGLVCTSFYLMAKLGWGNLVAGVETLKGQAGFNPFDANSLGTPYILWMTFLGLISCAVWQTSVIRSASAEDTQVVRRTFAWGSVGFLIRFLIPYFWGICALVFLAGRADLGAVFLDPDASKETTLRAMPIALTALIPGGAIGILTAGMLAAAMSTYNTYLHAWSSVFTQDILAPLLGGRLDNRTRIRSTQAFMFLQGVFLLVWGLWYPLGEDLWDYMAVTGAIYFTGAFAVLLCGLYWPRASRVGAYGAFICGFSAAVGLSPVQKVLGVEWPSEWVGLITVALTLFVMVAGSLIFPDGVTDQPAIPRRAVVTIGIVAALVVGGLGIFMTWPDPFWQIFWRGLLGVGVTVFAVLMVLVIFYGFIDLKHLVTSLQARHREAEEEDDPADGPS